MSLFSSPEILTVTQITQSIKLLLEDEYRFVHISGEVSNLRRPHSGHLYFTLKDDSSQLRAVLFKSTQKFLDGTIDNGNQLVCHGKISVYNPRGEYQLIVDTIDFHGSGNLHLEYEKLKKKLQGEGLFDQQRKKTIPPYPRQIVLITSPSGAAIQDFLKICSLRKTPANIKVFPVRVQGEGSGEEISFAIERVNEEIAPDVLVLLRGGGSIEDLWAFNEECVARAISKSKIPIITGIGHEIDFTIADFCSDLRAATPTAAAELLIDDKDDLLDHIQSQTRRIGISVSALINSCSQRVSILQKQISNLESLFIRYSLDLDLQFSRFVHLTNQQLSKRQGHLDQLSLTLKHHAPTQKLQLNQERIFHLQKRLLELIRQCYHRKQDELSTQLMLLETVNPLATLARGYSIARKKDPITGEYTVVSDSSQASPKDSLQIILNKGRLECEVVDNGAKGS